MARLLAWVIVGILLLTATIAESACYLPFMCRNDAIALYGEVSEESANHVVQSIQVANKSLTNAPIYLYINSPGGSVMAGGQIIDAMVASRRPVYTIDISMAASMAAYIELYGVKRFMAPRAVLMFHDAHGGMQGDVSHMNSQVSYINGVLEGYTARIVELTSLPRDTVRVHLFEQWWIAAKDAVALKLIDEVSDLEEYPAQ